MFKSKICNQSYCVKQLKKVSCQCLNWSCLYWLFISAVISLLYEKGMSLVAHILKKKHQSRSEESTLQNATPVCQITCTNPEM